MLGLDVGLPRIRVRDTLCVRVTRKACNCSESVRYLGMVLLLSFCEAAKNLQSPPRRGRDTERGSSQCNLRRLNSYKGLEPIDGDSFGLVLSLRCS